MLKHEVPQDRAVLGDQREVCYAIDENGRYVLTESSGWDPANLANQQAWEAIRVEVAEVLTQIRQGVLSPLAFHMTANQMDEKLLADYAGLFRWQVRRHLRSGPFQRISPKVKARYAALFAITAEELDLVPANAEAARLQKPAATSS